ncbi:MAG: ABC transporter ATP-binding protein [Planctomycetota bacterium]|jgi:ATP-binding cassette subfamily B protein/subfamily B ATP-binding cassette protein MsbA
MSPPGGRGPGGGGYGRGFHEEQELGRMYDIRYVKRLWIYAKPFRKLLLFSLILLLFMSCIDLALPIMQKFAMDGAIATGSGARGDWYSRMFSNTDDDAAPVAVEEFRKSPPDFNLRQSWVPRDEKELEILQRWHILKSLSDNPENIKKISSKLAAEREGRLGLLYIIAVIFFVSVVVQIFFRVANVLTMEFAGQGIMMNLRMHIFKHCERLPLTFFDNNPTGRLVTRATNDVQAVYEAFNAVVVQSAADVFRFAGIVAAMFILSWQLTAVLFTTIPVIIVISLIFRVLHRKAFRRVRQTLARINAFLAENFSGIRVVKMFQREKENLDRFDGINGKYYSANMTQLVVASIFQPIMALVRVTAMGLLVWYGGGQFVQGHIDRGTLIAFIWYIEMFYAPIIDLSAKYNILQSAIAAGERIFLLLDEKPTITSPDKPFVPQAFRGKVEFRNVTFEYKPDEPVLRDVSFTIEPGQTFALVGATGAGKTTITNLVSRFYDVQNGAVLVDDVDVKEWDMHELRTRIATVMQDVFIFSGTIADNIRLGQKSISDEEVETAARITNSDGFIEQLPGEYNHTVYERGQNFSTGQRQLLSFTRALAFDPGILVLDEATANIDTHTEQLIQDALEKLTTGRTSIIVAHRLSTIRKANRILVFSHGRLAEEGSHDELISEKGLYYRLYYLQFDKT